jgi:putative heme iron utilization protein
VSGATRPIKATEVRIGDRLRTRLGAELTVTRIDQRFMGRDEMLAFVEDSDEQWLKLPARRDAEVELVSRAGEDA